MTAGPPQPLPDELRWLLDASWLFRCELSECVEVTIQDRPAYRVTVAAGDSPMGWLLPFPAVAVIDAELGILLRLTGYVGDRPALRAELRDITASPADPVDFREPPGVRRIELTGELRHDVLATATGVPGAALRTVADAARQLQGWLGR